MKKSTSGLSALYIVLFIDAMGVGLLFPLLANTLINPTSTALVTHMSANGRSVLYGVILTIYFVAWFFGAAILGDLSDSSGRKKALLICMGGIGLSYLITAMAFVWHSIALMLLGRIVSGLTAGSQPIAQAAITDVSPPEKLTQYIGYVLFFFTAGMVAGPVVGGFLSDPHLVSWFGNTTPLYFMVILAVINFFMLVFTFKETSSNASKVKLKLSRAITIFISAFQDKKVSLLSLVFMFLQMGFNGFYLYASVFMLKRYGFTGTHIGLYMGVMGIGLAIGTAILPGWFERRGANSRLVIISSYFILAAGILLMTLLHSALLAWILVIPTAAAFTLGYSNVLGVFSKQVSQEHQGWVMGITGAILALAMALTTVINGAVDLFSNDGPYYVAIFFIIAGILVFLKFKSRGNQKVHVSLGEQTLAE